MRQPPKVPDWFTGDRRKKRAGSDAANPLYVVVNPPGSTWRERATRVAGYAVVTVVVLYLAVTIGPMMIKALL